MKSNIDLPNEVHGPGAVDRVEGETTNEKNGTRARRSRSSIGQGQVSVTPVSMAVYAATLANGGTRVTPHLVKAIDDGKGWKPVPPPPPQSKVDVVAGEARRRSATGMWMVVNGGGTGGRARDRRARRLRQDRHGAGHLERRAASRRRGASKDLRDHGWFVFFAPRDNPEIAGVVFLEHGIHGPNAAPVAHHILETYFAKKDGKPLPPPPTHEDMRLDYKDPVRAPRGGARRAAATDAMFERRLYFHIDWLLLAAVLAAGRRSAWR